MNMPIDNINFINPQKPSLPIKKDSSSISKAVTEYEKMFTKQLIEPIIEDLELSVDTKTEETMLKSLLSDIYADTLVKSKSSISSGLRKQLLKSYEKK